MLNVNTGNPGLPMRWRGWCPQAPEDGAAPKAPAAPAPAPATPAPAAPAAPGPTLTPAAPAAPATPAAPAAPTRQAVPGEAADILAQLRGEHEAIAKARADFQKEVNDFRAVNDGQVAAARREFVRAMPGLKVDFADPDLDAIVPREDPRTEAGKAKLFEWREKGGARYFDGPATAPVFDEAKWAVDVVGGEANANRPLFNARHVRESLQEKRTW